MYRTLFGPSFSSISPILYMIIEIWLQVYYFTSDFWIQNVKPSLLHFVTNFDSKRELRVSSRFMVNAS